MAQGLVRERGMHSGERGQHMQAGEVTGEKVSRAILFTWHLDSVLSAHSKQLHRVLNQKLRVRKLIE